MAAEGWFSSGIMRMGMAAKVVTLWGLFRVGAAGEDGKGAVELLGEDHARQFVRERHGAERKFLRDALTQRFGETTCVPANKNELACAAVAQFTEPPGQRIRIECSAARVEKNGGCGAVGVEFLEGGVGIADFHNFDGARVADAFYIVAEKGAHFRPAGLADQ